MYTSVLYDALVDVSVKLDIMNNLNKRIAVGLETELLPPAAAAEILFQMEEISQKLVEAYNGMAHMAASDA